MAISTGLHYSRAKLSIVKEKKKISIFIPTTLMKLLAQNECAFRLQSCLATLPAETFFHSNKLLSTPCASHRRGYHETLPACLPACVFPRSSWGKGFFIPSNFPFVILTTELIPISFSPAKTRNLSALRIVARLRVKISGHAR